MLAAFSVVALVKVYSSHAPDTAVRPSLSWLNPFEIGSGSAFVNGVVLMLFLYWRWETSLTVTEETVDPHRTPGRSAMGSTILLLALYLMATVAALAFAGIGSDGIGLGNPDNMGDIFSALGGAVFGTTGIGSVMFHLLILMVLTSAAASTETTVLTLGRTMLSMGRNGALPKSFGSISPKFRVPKVGTIATGVAGAVVYVIMNFVSHGQVIADAVSSCAVMIAFYYGLTGLTSAWAYRAEWHTSATDRWLRIVLPAIGGLTLVAAGGWFLKTHWDPANSMTSWTLPIAPHWHVGGVFIIGVGALVLGWLVMVGFSRVAPAFFDAGITTPEPEAERKREMA
jgi:amino acid transporter